MDHKLEELKRKSTSGSDILNYIDGKANLISYPEIYNYKTLNQLLGPHKACVILYEWKNGYGHWVCCFQSPLGENIIEFFDPYAYKPDSEFEFIKNDFQLSHYPDNRYLSKLIYESGKELDYNNHHLQNQKDHSIASCGPHTACRLENRNIPLDNYAEILSSFKPYTSDDIVTMLFYNK